MAYDLLELKNDVFIYSVETGKGKERKEATLQDKDELWAQMRHKFIADVQRELGDMGEAYRVKDKTAQYKVSHCMPLGRSQRGSSDVTGAVCACICATYKFEQASDMAKPHNGTVRLVNLQAACRTFGLSLHSFLA